MEIIESRRITNQTRNFVKYFGEIDFCLIAVTYKTRFAYIVHTRIPGIIL